MGNGHAWEYIQKNPKKNHVGLVLQIAEGIKYLHDLGVVHGDLRGDNVLISREGVARIGDFGLSQKLAETPGDYSSTFYKAGNIRFMAPELLKAETFEEALRTAQTDMFAFGRVAYQLLAMRKPYAEIENDTLIPLKVMTGVVPTRVNDEEAMLRGLNDDTWDLMWNCWCNRPEERPNAAEAILRICRGGHQIHDLRQHMLSLPASDRIQCIPRLSHLYYITNFYPTDPSLDSCEVRVLDRGPLARQGSAEYWKGLFLNKYEVTMKRLHSDIPKEFSTRRLKRELGVWRGLDHPNISRFIGHYFDKSSMYLISPWMEDGHAWEYVQKNPNKNHVELLLQVAQGLEYLHTLEIVHGDLRGHNIFISHEGVACIGNFGLSRKLAENPDDSSSSWLMGESLRYMAPELLSTVTFDEVLRTTQTDMFAFGRVAYQLLAMREPYADISSNAAIIPLALNGVNPVRVYDHGATRRGLGNGMWDLMRRCWRKRPGDRPNAVGAVLHIRNVDKWVAPSSFSVLASLIFRR
ncbi:hypothetical protein BOTBODRAFT_36635 [Botryobasidium botryosum FD-172 SS1]|uniref:Protein kinase domain-containing protein n=1 Tax=Botryobasidium botryosum (strain FD-172 SS1) TaxID=930990 RepID=A0A067MDP8_BOTB1|nr:hypothetical protein BOTBODRAFT_36635 [Botryobasidium botryosum FD-172 SS1]